MLKFSKKSISSRHTYMDLEEFEVWFLQIWVWFRPISLAKQGRNSRFLEWFERIQSFVLVDKPGI